MEYKVIRSQRKTISLEISRKTEVIVRAPLWVSKQEIEQFVIKHKAWIQEKKEKLSSRPTLTPEAEQILKEKAKQFLPGRAAYFSQITGLIPKSIRITSAKTRLGSCSAKGRICFSYLLMQYPSQVIDYVIVHELAHLKHLNHGKEFYSLIARFLPDYKERIKLMKSQ